MKDGTLPTELESDNQLKDYKLFSDEERLKKWRNFRSGIGFTDEKGNKLYGSIDNLLIKEERLLVLDYKTRGFPLKEDTHKFSIPQMNIYTYLFRKKRISD